METFTNELIFSIQIYMVWFIAYSIYLIVYAGNSETMCKYMYKIIPNEQPSLKMKLLWLIAHFSTIIITCSF